MLSKQSITIAFIHSFEFVLIVAVKEGPDKIVSTKADLGLRCAHKKEGTFDDIVARLLFAVYNAANRLEFLGQDDDLYFMCIVRHIACNKLQHLGKAQKN